MILMARTKTVSHGKTHAGIKSVVFAWVSWKESKKIGVSCKTFVKKWPAAPRPTDPGVPSGRFNGRKRTLMAKLTREKPRGEGGEGEGGEEGEGRGRALLLKAEPSTRLRKN